jgi:hypothetical protein
MTLSSYLVLSENSKNGLGMIEIFEPMEQERGKSHQETN